MDEKRIARVGPHKVDIAEVVRDPRGIEDVVTEILEHDYVESRYAQFGAWLNILPDAADIGDWDRALLERYPPLYMLPRYVCRDCDLGPCDLEKTSGKCGLTFGGFQGRLSLRKACRGCLSQMVSTRRLLDHALKIWGEDRPVSMGEVLTMSDACPPVGTLSGIYVKNLRDLNRVLSYGEAQLAKLKSAGYSGVATTDDFESMVMHAGSVLLMAMGVAEMIKVACFGFASAANQKIDELENFPPANLAGGWASIEPGKPVIAFVGDDFLPAWYAIESLKQANALDKVELCGIGPAGDDVVRFYSKCRIVAPMVKAGKAVRNGVFDVILASDGCLPLDLASEAARVGSRFIWVGSHGVADLPDLTDRPVDDITNFLVNGQGSSMLARDTRSTIDDTASTLGDRRAAIWVRDVEKAGEAAASTAIKKANASGSGSPSPSTPTSPTPSASASSSACASPCPSVSTSPSVSASSFPSPSASATPPASTTPSPSNDAATGGPMLNNVDISGNPPPSDDEATARATLREVDISGPHFPHDDAHIIAQSQKCLRDCDLCSMACPNTLPISKAVKQLADGKWEGFEEVEKGCYFCGKCEVACPAGVGLRDAIVATERRQAGKDKFVMRAGRGPLPLTEILQSAFSMVWGNAPGIVVIVGCGDAPRDELGWLAYELTRRNCIVFVAGCAGGEIAHNYHERKGKYIFEQYLASVEPRSLVNCGGCAAISLANNMYMYSRAAGGIPLYGGIPEVGEGSFFTTFSLIVWGALPDRMYAAAAAYARLGIRVVVGPASGWTWGRYLPGNRYDRSKWWVYHGEDGRKRETEPIPEHLIVPVETKEEALTMAARTFFSTSEMREGRAARLDLLIELYRVFYGQLPEDWNLLIRSHLDIPTRHRIKLIRMLRDEHGWEGEALKLTKARNRDGELLTLSEFNTSYGMELGRYHCRLGRLLPKNIKERQGSA